MKITFLGTSSGLPTRERNVSAIAFRFSHTSEWMLFDCGEATQHQIIRTSYTLPKLRNIFVTHLHGDHCFGLFGLLASRSLNNAEKSIQIVGPCGIRDLLQNVFEKTQSHFRFDLKIKEIENEKINLQVSQANIQVIPLEHSIPSYAYMIREKEKPGKFDVEKAKQAEIPSGPIYGRLKKGEKVKLLNGKIVDGKDFIGKPIPGRKVIIAGDNKCPEILLPHLDNCDLLVHEANYTEEVKKSVGKDYFHSTAKQVAAVAQQAGVPNLILTHFSARFSLDYSRTRKYSIEDVRAEALSEYCGKLFLAEDLETYSLNGEGNLHKEKSRS